MKRLLSFCLIAISMVAAAKAQSPAVSSYDLVRDGDRLTLDMSLSTPDGIKSDREIMVTPVLRSLDSADTLAFSSLVIAGRSRYYTNLRRADMPAASLVKATSKSNADYSSYVDFLPWMEYSQLDIVMTERGCCGAAKEEVQSPMALLDFRPKKFDAVPAYVHPVADNTPKTRKINGSAYIDFPVNITEIRPSYRRNPTELAKINATIDSVKLDDDITIDALSIKGFASPEGSYSNNVRLARGRTEALKNYVQSLHHFAPEIISTSYEPEDWEGLRRFVAGAVLNHRDEILAVIDSSLEPDAKDAKLKKAFPEEYAYLLREVYPALRHSDYTVDYTIRTYSNPKEILQLVKTAPQKLSLNEFCLAAETLDPASSEYENLWDTAFRMYPDSEVAIINAANAALSRGHIDRAELLIQNAGDSPDAVYTKGNIAALKGNMEEARNLFEQAARMKVADAPEALKRLEAIAGRNAITRLM